MGILLFTAGSHYLLKKQIELDYEKTRIAQQVNDVQQFSDFLGRGDFTMSAITRLPQSMVARAQGAVQNAHGRAMMYANQNIEGAMQHYYANMEMSGQEKAMRRQELLNNLYKQAMDQELKRFQAMLSQEEKELSTYKEKIDDRAAAVEKALEKFEAKKKEAIKEMIPDFGSGN